MWYHATFQRPPEQLLQQVSHFVASARHHSTAMLRWPWLRQLPGLRWGRQPSALGCLVPEGAYQLRAPSPRRGGAGGGAYTDPGQGGVSPARA